MDSSQLSFVVQGPIDPFYTKRVVEGIRHHFSRSEIIVSTWEGSKVFGLPYDKIIFSKDPGTTVRLSDNVPMNSNRLHITTRAGLAQASRPYAIKIRSDLGVTSDRILGCLNKLSDFPARDPKFSFTQDRVVVTNTATVNPHNYLRMPLHICDWLYAGRREDIISIFDIPPYPEEEFAQWFNNHPLPSGTIFPAWSRYANESYIIYHFAKKFMPITFEHSYDTSNNNIEMSERIFANNFVIYNNEQLGISSYKHKVLDKASRHWMYTHYDWVNLYNKFCAPKKKVVNINPSEKIKNWYFFHYQKYSPLIRYLLPKALLRPLYHHIRNLRTTH